MIVIRKTTERHYQRDASQDSWLSFGPSEIPTIGTFGRLAVFRERKLIPKAAQRETGEEGEEGEVITYVRAGSLAYQHSAGVTGVIRHGEFQLRTALPAVGSREMNVSPVHEAHVFQVRLRPGCLEHAPHEGTPSPVPVRRKFSSAERKGRLCAVASLDRAGRALQLKGDAILYSALFDPGQVVVYNLARGRGAWLHVVSGSLKFGAFILESGDGAGFTEETELRFVVLEPTEVLLLDLGHFSPEPLRHPSNIGAKPCQAQP